MAFSVIVAGGGPAAIEAVLTLRDLAPEAAVTVLAPEPDFVYRPLSVVEPFARAGVRRYALAELGVPVHRGSLAAVEAEARAVVTEAGERLHYDALLIAAGIRQRPAVRGATLFSGPASVEAMHGLVQDIEGGYIRSVAFVAPEGAGWTLPLYELALQTAERADDMNLSVDVSLTTPEAAPLDVFGYAASDLVASLLDAAGISFATGTAPPATDRVVALGVPEPPAIAGLPPGFLAVDESCAVETVEDVWAAGDVTAGALKQGGLAAQQAAAAAGAIAVRAGARSTADPYQPVLRAMLIAGRRACYFRRRLDGIDPGMASYRALWWPPSKIAGPRLAPFLDAIDARERVASVERKLAGERVKRRTVVAPGVRARLP